MAKPRAVVRLTVALARAGDGVQQAAALQGAPRENMAAFFNIAPNLVCLSVFASPGTKHGGRRPWCVFTGQLWVRGVTSQVE
jgi:hypothetical protein